MITAYTFPYNRVVNRIIVKCFLSLPKEGALETDPLNALWDTGAMSTCVSLQKAAELGLSQVGSMRVTGANNEPFDAPIFVVRLRNGAHDPADDPGHRPAHGEFRP